MFWPDVIVLKEFYNSPLGEIAERQIQRAMSRFWPEFSEEYILGIGYTLPYFSSFKEGDTQLLSLMPASQGVVHWPHQDLNRTCLADEAELPFPDSSIERIVIIHTVEHTQHLHQMMEEVWRVLTPLGKVLVVVPNRKGLWSRIERTPFSQGRPFSSRQLRKFLRDMQFTPLRSESVLFVPPCNIRMILKAASLWEWLGRSCLPGFGGVLMMEAEKQVYAMTGKRALKKKKGRVFIPNAKPAMP